MAFVVYEEYSNLQAKYEIKNKKSENLPSASEEAANHELSSESD